MHFRRHGEALHELFETRAGHVGERLRQRCEFGGFVNTSAPAGILKATHQPGPASMLKSALLIVSLFAMPSVVVPRMPSAADPISASMVPASIVLSAPSPVQLEYTLRVDLADLSGIFVQLRVRNAPASIQLAAHAHPEYDDKYWRYLSDMRATGANGADISVVAHDSVLWRVNNVAGDVTIRYRVRFPKDESPRGAWKPFLAPTGGLVGGPHSFLYVIGQETAPVTVTLDLPKSWHVGTGLSGKSTSRAFNAPNVHTLMESPMLVGIMSEWSFRVKNIPHRVFYWRLPNAIAFDTVRFVAGLEKVATGAINLFGSAPYADFTFLMQDGAYDGGLEHPNSVTLGAQSADLAKDPNTNLYDSAHEFFHTWNLMAIKPVEYREMDYRVQPPVASLWFSEGLTMFYADLLLRRASLSTYDSTRVAHLEQLISRYLSMPGNARYSAEAVSRVEYNAPAGALGDYTASPHLQGEVIGSMIDLRVRSATNGKRTIDDVMRGMFARFGKVKFTNADVERTTQDVCGCSVRNIFDKYVRHGNAMDFNSYLAPFGLRTNVTWAPATGNDGRLRADLSIWAFDVANEKLLRLRVSNPAGIWAKAGLHTNDQLQSVNGKPVATWQAFRQILTQLKIGDSLNIVVIKAGKPFTVHVVVAGFSQPQVRLTAIPGATASQKQLQAAWVRGQ